MRTNLPIFTSQLESAFVYAMSCYPELHRRWVRLSHRVGQVRTTAAMLMPIQQVGHMDLMLRTMEVETTAQLARGDEETLWAPSLQFMLSGMWVLQAYEVVRSYCEAKDRDVPESVADLLRVLELVRVPLAKQQIAKDSRLKHPLKFKPIDFHTPPQTYDRSDPRRSTILLTGIVPELGSVAWSPIDVRNGGEVGIVRCTLADRFLDVFDPLPPA